MWSGVFRPLLGLLLYTKVTAWSFLLGLSSKSTASGVQEMSAALFSVSEEAGELQVVMKWQ